MNQDIFFILPDGGTATELEVLIPVVGHRKCPASIMVEVDELHDLLDKHMQMQSWSRYGSLKDKLASVLSGYERVASEALDGASAVRDDMVSYLRSVQFVVETITGDHISHHEKNARLRGVLALLGKHIESLRQERFTFRDSTWRRTPDLFRWDEPERRLRERVRELERENAELRSTSTEQASR